MAQEQTSGNGADEARAAMADAARTASNEAQALASSAMRAMQETLQVARDGVAERTERTGQAFHEAARQLGGQDDPMGGLIESAAARLDEAARTIREGDLATMASQIETFARRQPALFLAGAALAGFAISRMAGSGRRDGDMMGAAREKMDEAGRTLRERGDEARREMQDRFAGAAPDGAGQEETDYAFGQGHSVARDPIRADEDRAAAARGGSQHVAPEGGSTSAGGSKATGEPTVPTRTHPSQPEVADPKNLNKGAKPQQTGRDSEPRAGD